MEEPYKIHLEMYEGPLDLLLDLIRRQEIDIHNIPIAKLTKQYVEYLGKLELLDIDVSADFLYMAATLIHIKSKMLLPMDPILDGGAPVDPRDELVHRLLEHERYKNAAALLYEKQQVQDHVWSQPDLTLYASEETEGELVVSLVDLVRVFQAVLERRKEEVKIELHRETFTVGQMMEKLRTQLVLNDAPVSLTGFFEACPSKHAMIVAFLAVLEMVRMQVVLLVQEKLFEDVMLRKRKMFDVVFATKGNGIAQIDEQYL